MQKFIESGILSVYVLGIATEEEKQEVERMAALYPEVRKELESLQSTLNEYVAQYELPVPAHVKNKVLEKIHHLENHKELTLSAQNKNQKETVIPLPNLQKWKYGLVASWVLLAFSGLLNLQLYQELKETQRELSIAKSQNLEDEKRITALQTQYQTLEQELALVQNPDYQITYLQGLQEVAPKSYATVFWNEKENKAFIFTNSLPKPPKGKQYQLWALTEDNIIWDAGVFDWGKFSPVKCFKKPQKFIITLEKQGGVPKAEGTAYAIGSVKS
ncbi:MAG: anti-sigma factor [Raineya sp.]|nr:anti-sigma factor [Raineya sp.]